MTRTPANTLTAEFAGGGDIRHDLEFVIYESDRIHPGTRIVAGHAEAQGSYLEVIKDTGQAIWEAEWHDRTGKSAHDRNLFRIHLIPPIEYEDGLPVRRQFKVEAIGDHELSSPWSAR